MQTIPIAYVALTCTTIIIAFSIYFDHRRHKDPEFRRKLKERRNRRLREQNLPHYEILPRDINPKNRESHIINEIQLAENLMSQQKLDIAIVHFARAISVCADPAHLLNCLRYTLPAAAFDALIELLMRMCKEKKLEVPKKLPSDIGVTLAF